VYVGMSVALVEQSDFASGTSSRSTKLIHGGVRYLQKAILGFDVEQYRMVKEALAERANLIEIAPHLAYPLPIMLPVYKFDVVTYLLRCFVLHAFPLILSLQTCSAFLIVIVRVSYHAFMFTEYYKQLV